MYGFYSSLGVENLLTQVMGQQVEIIKVLPTETVRKSEDGSVMKYIHRTLDEVVFDTGLKERAGLSNCSRAGENICSAVFIFEIYIV